jgi:hypothetical protein
MGALGYCSETLVEYCMRRARGWMIAVFDRRFDQVGSSSAPRVE